MGKKAKGKKKHRRPIVSISEIPTVIDSMELLEYIEMQADLDWDSLVELYGKDWVTEDFIRRHWMDGVGNRAISGRGNLSKGFIDEFSERLQWHIMLEKQQFDEIMLEKYYSHIKYLWEEVLRYQRNVSESFVINHSIDIERETALLALEENKVMPDITKNNIREFLLCHSREQSYDDAVAVAADEQIWESLGTRYDISSSGDLEPEFIEKFKDRLDWQVLLNSQQFDEAFFEKYYDYIYPERFALMQYQDVPESFVKRHLEDFDNNDIAAIDDNEVMSDEHKKNIVRLFPKERQKEIIGLFWEDSNTCKLFEEVE